MPIKNFVVIIISMFLCFISGMISQFDDLEKASNPIGVDPNTLAYPVPPVLFGMSLWGWALLIAALVMTLWAFISNTRRLTKR